MKALSSPQILLAVSVVAVLVFYWRAKKLEQARIAASGGAYG